MTNWLQCKMRNLMPFNLFMSLMTLSAQFGIFLTRTFFVFLSIAVFHSLNIHSDAFYLKYAHHSRHRSKWPVIINLLIFSRLFWLAMDHDIPKMSIFTRVHLLKMTLRRQKGKCILGIAIVPIAGSLHFSFE